MDQIFQIIDEYPYISTNRHIGNLSDTEVLKILNKYGYEELIDYVKSEELKGEIKNEAPSIKEMKRLELADNESSSDSGNHRMYPNGQLMFSLIKDWQERIAKYDLGAMEIASPLFYNKADKQILAQCGSFHERHYSVKVPDDPNKEFILRFALDFSKWFNNQVLVINNYH